MRLEDALLYVILGNEPLLGVDTFCAAAIAGGADVIHVGQGLAGHASTIRDICRRDDALFVVSDDTELASTLGADGVHLTDGVTPVGQVRTIVGEKCFVGVSTRNRTDALLALEMGVDYLLHWSGAQCPAEFAALPGAAGNALFAAGLRNVADARTVVEMGVYRLCIDASVLTAGDITENAAAFSRLLGRSI